MNANQTHRSLASTSVNRVRSWLTTLAKRDRGGLLLEMAISVIVFFMVGTALLRGLGTAHISGANTENQSLAENVARNQMEYIAAQPYDPLPATYAAGVALPTGYTIDARGEEIIVGDPNIQKVIVDVYYEGAIILTLETIKADLQN